MFFLKFQVISQKVSIKALNSSQRLYLIKQGLLDRSEAVREVVKKQLFQAWLLTFNVSFCHGYEHGSCMYYQNNLKTDWFLYVMFFHC